MNNFLVKKKSQIHEAGIFTEVNIKKGEKYYQVPTNIILKKPKARCAHIGNGKWICDENVLNYVNHSCDANSTLDISKSPKLIAKKNIMAGEEITVNYNRTEKGEYKILCNCQKTNCKKYFSIIK